MKILIYIMNLKDALTGRELKNTLNRNAAAADELDRAVREMLKK